MRDATRCGASSRPGDSSSWPAQAGRRAADAPYVPSYVVTFEAAQGKNECYLNLFFRI